MMRRIVFAVGVKGFVVIMRDYYIIYVKNIICFFFLFFFIFFLFLIIEFIDYFF